ncbi:Hypothetical protein CpOVI2C_00168 [Corynebacterium pseudotuberculosis]|nr:Hypothetical protein CpOVI2C_00168 [Corynebacterium pseudotuberculosis]
MLVAGPRYFGEGLVFQGGKPGWSVSMQKLSVYRKYLIAS